ncbi:MAG: hypothetical protein VW802_13125 [Rhodospirillaceae bacterium]|jgi:uncharacterized membrane protein YeaQ/YmgE (transglycosylase-associated protein family)
MKWIIIAALRLSIYLGAIATIATGALVGYVGGLNIENFAVTGYAGAVVGGVVGTLVAGLVFGTLTVLLDIRDNLVVIRERTPLTPGEAAFRETPRSAPTRPAPSQEEAASEPAPTGESRKEPFLSKS